MLGDTGEDALEIRKVLGRSAESVMNSAQSLLGRKPFWQLVTLKLSQTMAAFFAKRLVRNNDFDTIVVVVVARHDFDIVIGSH